MTETVPKFHVTKTRDALLHKYSKIFASPVEITIQIDITDNSTLQVDMTAKALHGVLCELLNTDLCDLLNTAAGPKGIPSAIYKRFITILTLQLLLLFQKSLFSKCIQEV